MRVAALTCLLALLSVSSSYGQQSAQQNPPASPGQQKEAMQNMLNTAIQMYGPMMDASVDAQLKTAARPETAERIATFKKNLYDSLVKRGFKADEALQITVSTPIPAGVSGWGK